MHHKLHGDGLLQQTYEHCQDAESQSGINSNFRSVHPRDGTLRELETEDEHTQANNNRDTHVEDVEHAGQTQTDAHAQLAVEEEGSAAEVVERDGREQCAAEVQSADHLRPDFGAETDGALFRHLGEDCVGLDHDPVETCLLLEEAEEKCHPG